HGSACCTYGTTLQDEEAQDLSERFGADWVYQTRWGEWRTRVRGGRCVFLENNVCIIHGDRSYPAVCRGFPWVDAETGGPYEFDQGICPEFLAGRSLVQIQGIGGRARRQVANR
ncbi:MAG TPA: YkgJ family cysteine cluster protein, partial [Gemmatimonadales bacterium]|nr:YkgJ family cysteine cluster protein [Gemmatimonadales bacterium]